MNSLYSFKGHISVLFLITNLPCFEPFEFSFHSPHHLLLLKLLRWKKNPKAIDVTIFLVTFIRKNGVPMCSIQLLGNNNFNTPTILKSVKLGLLMWPWREKKRTQLEQKQEYKPWKKLTISVYNECRNDENFHWEFSFCQMSHHLQKNLFSKVTH
jgi:hypothetical protein